MKTRNERELAAVEQEMGRIAEEIKALWKKSETEDRAATDEERLEVEEKVKAIETVLKPRKAEVEAAIRVEQDVHRVSQEMGKGMEMENVSVTPGGAPQDRLAKTIGRLFVESKGYKDVQDAGFPGEWSTGPMEFDTKGTLLEGAGAPGAGTGGGLLTVPDVAPGVVSTLFQIPRVANLFAQGTTTSNTVRYVVEGTATNNAAGVAEAGAKPESILALSTKDEPIKKIATVLQVSDEMLEDAAQVESYINARLSLFIQLREDVSVLRGAGTNDLAGILDSSRGISTNAGGTAGGYAAADTFSMQIFKAMNGIRGSAFLEPDAIVMNPADWQTIRLARDTANQFYGGGPFQGPYGAGDMFQASGLASGALDHLWGKPVVVTSTMNAGTALVGCFQQGALVWRRQGITVEATNSHSTNFTFNLVAIRAEERLGLTVYRPTAFCAQSLSGTVG